MALMRTAEKEPDVILEWKSASVSLTTSDISNSILFVSE